MSIFYIKTKSGDIYELTATTDVAFQHRNTNTRFPVESGATITDHSVVENSTFSLSGIITQVVNLTATSPQKGIKEYIEGLDKLRKSKELFTVFLDNRLAPYPNCLFTDFSGSKGVSNGLGSWNINLSIEQVRIVDSASASLVKVAGETTNADNASEDKKDTLSGKKDAGSKPTLGYTGLGTNTSEKKDASGFEGATPPDAITGAR